MEPLKLLRWSFFAKNVNGLKPKIIFVKKSTLDVCKDPKWYQLLL